jgi:P pilus assembly chaperone PapD
MKGSLRTLLVAALLVSGSTLFPGQAQANVIIAGTRVIFPAQDGEVTVRLSNDNTVPALVEAWVDDGDPHSTPDKVHTPFLITPPLFRMDPHQDQDLRILATSPNLPSDRESIFWLNVLEIPPKPTGDQFKGKNLLQVAIRSRLKLFYRPAGLPGDANKAPGQLTWKVVADGKGYALEAHNPTPYHITVTQTTVQVGGTSYNTNVGMVDPFGTLRLAFKQAPAQAPAAGTAINYDIINDYGAVAVFKGTVAP